MASTTLSHLLSTTRKLSSSHLLLLNHRRLLSSEPPINQPPQIEPVSYAPKPKPEPESTNYQPQQPPPSDESTFSNFTKEDLRFMKDSPLSSISQVSYPKRVAPLPEDRVDDGLQLDAETKRIEDSNRVIRRVFKVAEQVEQEVPFPKFIKVDDNSKSSAKKVFDLHEAIRQVKANAKRNFDETLEAHVNLGIDRRRSDLGVSGAVVLPHGTGKIVKVAVFAEGAEAEEARAAGADIVGADQLIEEIKTSGKINFDKCIATHSMMQRVTKIGRILRGLTPNAKKGTVTNNVAVAVKEAKQGLLDFRMKDAIVHVGLGKVSFTEEALQENVGAFVNALLLAKPPGLKKTSKYAGYVNSFHLCSTMGPGFPISIQSLSRAADTYSKMHAQ